MSELFLELGVDPSSPEMVAARDDARNASRVIECLVQARNDSGLSQVEVARLMGTTQSAVSDIERTASDHHLSTLQRYARAVGGRIRTAVVFSPTVQTSWRDEGTVFVAQRRISSAAASPPAWSHTEIRAEQVLETA